MKPVVDVRKTLPNKGGTSKPHKHLDQILDRRDENGPQEQAEGDGRKARKGNSKKAARRDVEATSKAVAPAVVGTQAQAPATFTFAQQVAGIFALPLSDAEKAEAVRRLLASQTEKGVTQNDRL